LISLFKKDKKHDENINELKNLVSSQEEINNSLKGQMEELKSQTEILHNRNLFQIDENKMNEKRLKLDIQRYSDETVIKFEELRAYVIEQLNGLEIPIIHQLKSFKEASEKLALKENNGFEFTIDPSLKVNNLQSIDNRDLFKAFMTGVHADRPSKIESYLKLEKGVAFIQYMKEELKNDITSIYERYQTYEDQWGQNVQKIQAHLEHFVSQNMQEKIEPQHDPFVEGLDNIASNWYSMQKDNLNIRDTYFMRNNYVEPIRILCNKFTTDNRTDLLLPLIVNSEGAYMNIDNLRNSMKKVIDNYYKNLEKSWERIQESLTILGK
jgi:hypothetical protein